MHSYNYVYCTFIQLLQLLISRVLGLTSSLLTTSSGEKLGKSAGNAVWLSPHKTSPYNLYQYLVQTTDQDVQRLLLLFTFMSVQEVEELMAKHLVCMCVLLYWIVCVRTCL